MAAYLGIIAVLGGLTLAAGEPLLGILPILLTAPASLLVVTAFNVLLWPDVWDASIKSVTMAALSALVNVAAVSLLHRFGRRKAGSDSDRSRPEHVL